MSFWDITTETSGTLNILIAERVSLDICVNVLRKMLPQASYLRNLSHLSPASSMQMQGSRKTTRTPSIGGLLPQRRRTFDASAVISEKSRCKRVVEDREAVAVDTRSWSYTYSQREAQIRTAEPHFHKQLPLRCWKMYERPSEWVANYVPWISQKYVCIGTKSYLKRKRRVLLRK